MNLTPTELHSKIGMILILVGIPLCVWSAFDHTLTILAGSAFFAGFFVTGYCIDHEETMKRNRRKAAWN